MVQKRPHIIHLHTAPIWRGAEKQLVYLIEGLSLHGFQQTLFCLENSPMHQFAGKKDWDTVSFQKKTGASLGLMWQVRRFCSSHPVDLILIHDSHALNAWLLASSIGLNIPAVLHRRAHFTVGRNIFSRWKYNHSGIRGIICVSEQVRQSMLPVIEDKNKLIVVPDAVDVNLFRNCSFPLPIEKLYPECAGKYKVATIAALVEHKDLPTFIRMAEYLIKELGRYDMHFFIIGTGPLRNQLENLVQQAGIASYITFTGFIEDMPALMKALDVYVFCSVSEAFGSTLLEALSSGLPVVATAAGAGREILKHGKDALITETGDYKTLSRHVVSVCDNPTLRQSLISNGYLTAGNFSIDQQIEELSSIYLSCINSRKE